MSDPSNVLTVGSSSQIIAAVPPEPAASSSAPRVPPNVLTYTYASRMVYVVTGETYDVRSPSHLALFRLPPSECFADRSSSCPPPARHRYRPGDLPGTQGRRTPANQVGGPRCAQKPANTQDRGDRAYSLAFRSTVTRPVRNCGNTRSPRDCGGTF